MCFHRKIYFVFLIFLLLIIPVSGYAWPSFNQWIPVYRDGAILQDANGDSNGSRNIVSGSSHPAAFIFNDGTYFYFRLRLDDDPTGTGGQGLLKSFGWGVEFDTNGSAADYEWLIMLDGISQSENISLQQNTVQGTTGDPGDKAEITVATIPLTGNFQIVTADSSFNSSQDYFLDWRFPYATLKNAMGLTDSSPIRIFEGSSSSTNTLTENGADLAGASDLYGGFSDYITPMGTVIRTGMVKFVADLAGNGDVTEAAAGSVIYISVDDLDRNYDFTIKQTITVTITAPSGDSETITATETGVNTGIFTSSIQSVSSRTTISGDGILQVKPGEIITVRYIEPIDAGLHLNQLRTDTLLIFPPAISVTKTVTPASALPNGTVTYTVTVSNSGKGDGWLTSITDTLPNGFTYVAGSSSGVTSTDPNINGHNLTWSGIWTIPAVNGGINGSVSLVFKATAATMAATYPNNVSVTGSNFAVTASGPVAPVTVAAPQMSLTKQVDKTTASPGEEIVYTIHFKNVGSASAHTVFVMDSIPLYTTYVVSSLRLGTAGSTYVTASPLTDAAGDDRGQSDGQSISFSISSVAADDGVAGSGADEGNVFYKVRIE